MKDFVNYPVPMDVIEYQDYFIRFFESERDGFDVYEAWLFHKNYSVGLFITAFNGYYGNKGMIMDYVMKDIESVISDYKMMVEECFYV